MMKKGDSSNGKPNYRPPRDEVIDAILATLKESKLKTPPTASEVKQIIKSENPTWKLPERRVAKHLKRLLKEQNPSTSINDDVDDDDEESLYSETTNTSRLKSFASKMTSPLAFVSRKREGKSNSRSIPMDLSFPMNENKTVQDESSNLLPAEKTDDVAEVDEVIIDEKIDVKLLIADEKDFEQAPSVAACDDSDGTGRENEGEALQVAIDVETEVGMENKLPLPDTYKDDNDGRKVVCGGGSCIIL